MNNSVQVNKIIALFKELDEASRQVVLQSLKVLDKKGKTDSGEKTHHITDLAGLGAEKSRSFRNIAGVGADLWKDVDPDEYVRKLREEWDDRKF